MEIVKLAEQRKILKTSPLDEYEVSDCESDTRE